MKRLSILVLGAAALAAVQGCSDEPTLYLSGPPGPAVALKVSNSAIAMQIGGSTTVGVRAQDAVGNPTSDAVTLTACDALVTVGNQAASAQWTATATIAGVGMGTSCVLAQGAGITDTVHVVVGPAGVLLDGPDTILSGTLGQYTASFVDGAGSALTGSIPLKWTSSNTALLVVGELSGSAQGQTPGTVSVRAFAPGGANASRAVVIIPDAFAGSLSSASAAPGQLITVTQSAGSPDFDTDTQVRVGGVVAWVDGLVDAIVGRARRVMFAVPATGSTTSQALAFSNIGSGQVAQNGSFTPTQAMQDVYAPGNLDPFQGPVVDNVKSPGGHIYIVNSGACAGGVGADCDDFFTISAGATDRTVTVTVNWVNSAGVAGDLDILWVDEGFTGYVGNFDGAGSAKPEVSKVTIPANTTWRLWINNYSQTATQFSNARVSFVE
jgi:hypothetical protein